MNSFNNNVLSKAQYFCFYSAQKLTRDATYGCYYK